MRPSFIARAHAVLLATSVGMLAGATADAQTIAITGGRVYPVNGPPIDNGTVLIRDGQITAVGANVAIPADARRIDATGKWVTPGLINAATTLGAVEIGAVPDTRDFAAEGRDGIAAAFKVIDGLNPRSLLIAPARGEGVTTVAVVPGGGMIAGQAALIDLLDSASVPAMTVRASLFMAAQLGAGGPANTGARGELVLRMRELLEDVRAYARSPSAYETGGTRDFMASRADLEAMLPVLDGSLPLVIAADRASDISAAIRLAEEYDLDIMIAGGAEAWMVAGELARARVPVFAGALNSIPSGFAALGARQDNVALLQRAGVRVLLTGDGGANAESFNVRNIRYAAGNAVAHGMSWDDALRTVTLNVAEAFGVSDRYGSLQSGRVANVVVWSGDPFEFGTVAEHVFVRGRELDGTTREDLLHERYRTLPPNYRLP